MGELGRRALNATREFSLQMLQLFRQPRRGSAVGAGNCDGLEGRELRGWAWRPASPQTRVEVEQWVDGVMAARTVADLDRADLAAAGIGDGGYGWRMPLALDPAKPGQHRVEVRVRDGEPLPNGAFYLASIAPVSGDPEPTAGDVGGLDMKLNGWFSDETRELAGGFPISPDDIVVDVGAGDGGMAYFCARFAAETILVDSDQARLDRAVDRLGPLAARVEGRAGDASRLPVADGAVTRVVCTEVLEHVDDPVAVMAELVRIGRPGALYLLSAPGAVSEHLQKGLAPASYFEKPNHIRIFEADDFTRLVEDAGLVIERRSQDGFFWTIWWSFFWQAGIEFGEQSHPLLDAWNRTWSELLKTPEGPRIKKVLDGLAPKNVVLVARKPT
jgi:SAM-dependent methyltransferase